MPAFIREGLLPTTTQSAGFPTRSIDPTSRASRALTLATALWVGIAVAGQLLFALYVVLFYGKSAARGDMASWGMVMPRGWIAGDHAGNASIAAHLLVAVVISVCGGMQLLPWIRRRIPGVHRWSGRAYLFAAIVGSVTGEYLLWVRGTTGGSVRMLGTSVNGVAIICCAILAWRRARQRRIAAHREWALRLFLLSNGVWFFRVGLMLSLVVFGRPVGFDSRTFEGPFLTALAWVQFLVPLAVLELWLLAIRSPRASVRYFMAAGMLVLSAATAGGVFGATMGMWLPRM